jgi:hypothetical protein
MSAFGQRTFSTAIVMSALQLDCEKPLQPAFEETALVSQINLRRNEYAPRPLSGQEHLFWQPFLSSKTNHYST